MTSLLDLMGQPQAPRCPRRPMWRAGVPVPGSDSGYVPHQDGDLRWLSTGWDGRRWRGAWYRWDARRAEWRPLDPANRLCINHLPDTPPSAAVVASAGQPA